MVVLVNLRFMEIWGMNDISWIEKSGGCYGPLAVGKSGVTDTIMGSFYTSDEYGCLTCWVYLWD